MLEILIVDDDAAMRGAIAALLDGLPWLRVVGAAATMFDGLAAAGRLRPHVVLMDVVLPDGDGFSATERLLSEHPGTHVVVLTLHDGPSYERRARGAGAVGFVTKVRLDEELERVLHSLRKDDSRDGMRRGLAYGRGDAGSGGAGEP